MDHMCYDMDNLSTRYNTQALEGEGDERTTVAWADTAQARYHSTEDERTSPEPSCIGPDSTGQVGQQYGSSPAPEARHDYDHEPVCPDTASQVVQRYGICTAAAWRSPDASASLGTDSSRTDAQRTGWSPAPDGGPIPAKAVHSSHAPDTYAQRLGSCPAAARKSGRKPD